MIEAAGEVRERLRRQGLQSFVKTSGGKGLHAVAPLRPQAGWAAVKRFSQALAAAMAGDQPERYIAKSTIRERAGRIYVDYLRNSRGATAIGTYSTRARPGAPVSTPLVWEELSPAIRSSDFTVGSVPARLRAVGRDPWADMARVDQVLPAKSRARRS